MAESMKGRNIRPAYMSLSSEYRRADESLRSLLGENFLEPLPEQDEELFQQDKYRDFWRCIYGAGFFYIAGINVEDCLMVHALGLDVPSGDIPCVVANRKIGVLSGGALGILAPATYPGDEIYAFAVKANPMKGVGDICIHLLVLRPYPIKSITHASHLEYKTKRDNKGGWENIQHFTLVGCAWVGYDCLAMKRAYQIWDRKGFDSRDYEDNAWGDLKTTAWIYWWILWAWGRRDRLVLDMCWKDPYCFQVCE
jgi:hypothetical protein